MVRPSLPPALIPGSSVQVVAPAGPFDRDTFAKGLTILESRYRASFRDDLFSKEDYLAGSDKRRLDELSSALESDAPAVFCARGGYGAMRLLADLPFSRLRPKPLVGFSDITALHLALLAKGWVTIHGPVITQLGHQPREVADRLFSLLESSELPPPLFAETCLVPGSAEGILLGGNLSVLTRLIGTPYLPDFSGAVLLLEDVGERPYRLDRMWTHLKLSGILSKVAGIALGTFTGCEEKDGKPSSAEVLASLARETGLPCAAGFPIGHGTLNFPVALGTRVRLDASAQSLSFLEPAVRRAE